MARPRQPRPASPARNDGRSFEHAVAAFVQGLSPSTKVFRNRKVRDRLSGAMRDVDLWIETEVVGHLPLAIHGSCKDYGRRLDIGEIDAFQGELASSGAHVGVIYSSHGFSGAAVEKANALGISCCHLLDGAPPPTPTALRWTQYCFCSNRLRIDIISASAEIRRLKTNAELFGLPGRVEGAPKTMTLADHAEQQFRAVELEAVGAARDSFSPPHDFFVELTRDRSGGESDLVVRLTGIWRCYEARLEAHRVNGVYLVNDDRIIGSVSGPRIDTQAVEPGPGWIELPERPKQIRGIACFLYGCPVGQYLREPSPVRWPAPPSEPAAVR